MLSEKMKKHAAYTEVERLIKVYLPLDQPLNILDVGSRCVSGCFRSFFEYPTWKYTGLDMQAGSNVDVITDKPYQYPFDSCTFDVVVSGQCMEHVKAIWQWVPELARVLKPGGLLILSAPWRFKIHQFPVDCWRILPDGMRYIVEEWSGLQVLECYDREGFTFCAARKP